MDDDSPSVAALPRTITAYPVLTEAGELFAADRFEEAAKLVIGHLRSRPNEPQGTALLGAIAMKLGALIQAEQFFRKAIGLGLSSADVQRNLASTLNQQERLPEANALYERLESQVDEPGISAMRAMILDKLGRSGEALHLLDRLVETHPSEPAYWISRGHNLRAAGRTDDAVASYRRAIAIDPERGEAWWGLANIRIKVLTDADMAAMEEALAIAVDYLNVAPLHFALARGYHDRQAYERAFHHYSEGNRLKADNIRYRADELTVEVDESLQAYDGAFFDSTGGTETAGATPVFIVSLPRSGSTLLEQMLSKHPRIEAVGELPYAPAILRSLMEVHSRRGPISVPQLLARLSEEEKKGAGQDYLDRAAVHRRTQSPLFIDKLPHNWSNIAFIRQILPQAKFIDIRRSPIDCCFSNFTQSFSRAHAASFRLSDIGRCYVDYVRFTNHLDRVAPDLVHHVVYEQLVEQPERELRGVLDYLGLDWDESCLRFYESDRTVRTPSAEQVRRPLNREGMGVWEPYEQWLGPLFEALAPLKDIGSADRRPA